MKLKYGLGMTRPITPLLIALIMGISFSNLFPIPDTHIQFCLVSVLLVILLVSIKKNRHRILYPLLLFSFFLAGILETNIYIYPHIRNDHIKNFISNEKVTMEGMICDNPQVSPDKTELIVSSYRVLRNGEYLPVSGRLLLSIKGSCRFHYGDVIRFTSRLRIPKNFENPGGFDYEKYLRFKGILLRGFINDASGIVVLRSEAGNSLRTWLERFRERVRQSILETAPDTEGKIIQAMILGDQKEIPKETMDKFNRTGTIHIIAISGFNIGIVAVFSLFVFRLFLKSSEYLLLRWNMVTISTFSAILVVILYTFIAGSGISVVRASIMVVLFMIAILINRERDLFNTLTIAAFLILIVSPTSLFDISFQLSFAAVASLLFLMPRLTALLPMPLSLDSSRLTGKAWLVFNMNKALRALILFFFASLTATLGTLPLIILYFNRLSLITLAANLLVVPILGIIAIPFCLLIVLAVPISSTLTHLIVQISGLLVRISLYIVDELAALSWSSVYVTTPTFLEIGAFYLLLMSLGFCLDSSKNKRESLPPRRMVFVWKIIFVFVLFFFIFNGTLTHFRALRTDKLVFTAIDVGQGSSILIRFPGGKRMLVDGGGFFDESFDVGKYVLAPFLWHEKINRIDTVVLTHPHPDHLQGLLFILENFQVREVWTNGDELDSVLYLSFLQSLHDRGAVLKVSSDFTPEIDVSGVKIRILNPQGASNNIRAASPSLLPADNETMDAGPGHPTIPAMTVKKRSRLSDEMNDRSLVMQLSFGGRTFLLPGDISEEAEWRLVKSTVDLRSDVLFVPHHGGFRSSTSTFLDKVSPQIAVVSCGKDNIFRLPHPDVIRRYERLQSRIYRTDRDGAITISTNGNDLRAQTFRSVPSR
jgi:competence protein ComEC